MSENSRTTFTYRKMNGEVRDITTNTTKNPIVHFTPKYFDKMTDEEKRRYKTWFDLPYNIYGPDLTLRPEIDHTHLLVYDEVNDGWRTLICGYGNAGIQDKWDWEYVEPGAQPLDYEDDTQSVESMTEMNEPVFQRQNGVAYDEDSEPDTNSVMTQLLEKVSSIENILKSITFSGDGDDYPGGMRVSKINSWFT